MVAFNLEAGGLASVTAVLRSNYGTVKANGFSIDSCDHGRHVNWRPNEIMDHVPATGDGANAKPFDYLICTNKNMPDVPPALVDIIKPAITPNHTVVVLIQNGLNIEKSLHATFPRNICLSGVSLMSAYEFSPGYILQNDTDRLTISPFLSKTIETQKQIEAARNFQKLYAASGKVQCLYEPDVALVRWRKLLYNAVWNPVCALTNLDTTRIRLAFKENDVNSPVNILIRPAINEVRAAAKASAGVELPEELVDAVINADPMKIFCVPSMLQDRRKGNLLEHEHLLGEALREGEIAGVQMPVVRTLYGLCRTVQWQTMDSKKLVNSTVILDIEKSAAAGAKVGMS